MTEAAVAVADWGTTRLRIWLLDDSGGTIAERRSDEGLLSAQPDRFSAILEANLADMGAPGSLPVVICGMAGSRQGWVEAPYVTVPASPGEIFGAAVRIPVSGRPVHIVPGLAQRSADAPDVMRGEETQLAGAAHILSAGRHIVCMPGTHSKWVELADGNVVRFQTFMTGELFAVLASHSILSHALGTSPDAVSADAPAFLRACADGFASPGDLATRLFRIRAATLLQGLAPPDAASSLSGLLIGAEIGSASASFASGGTVVLVASGAMRDLYDAAFRTAGIRTELVDADEAVKVGLTSAARHFAMIAPKEPTR